MVKYLIFLIFLIFPLFSGAQSMIVGRVILQDGTPVSGVNIYSREQSIGTSSDSSGNFRLECKCPCNLEFSHVNYKTETVTIKENGKPFIIILRNKYNNLKELIVSGKATMGRVFSSQKGIEMIPAILGEQDILKYLATTPGIITTNALDPGIYVRGGNSSDNGFLVNDIEIASPDHLTGILSTFDPYVLNSSIVHKSGFPARYNSFLSSYINMKAEPGNKEKHEGEATLGLVSSSLKAKGPLLKNHTSFAASLRTSYLQTIAKFYNKSVTGNQNQNFMPEYAFNDAAFSLDSRISGKWKITGFGLFTADNLTMKLTEEIRHKFKWHTISGNVNAHYTPNTKDRWLMQAGVKSAYSLGDAGGSIPMGGGNRHNTFIGRMSYTRVVSDRLFFNIGGKFEQARFETANRLDETNNILIRSSDKMFNISEIYTDINYQLNDNITFYGGLNYQYYNGDSHTNILSPRAKISFSSRGFTLWADYAKTAQYMSLYPYFTVKTPVDIWYPLASGMKPAICHQYSLGAGQEINNILSFYAGVFYKDMRNVKDFSSGLTTEYTALTDNMINGSGYAKGIEFNFQLNLNNLHSSINYTLSESKRKFKEINNGNPFNPPYDVKHNLVTYSSWNINSRFTLNMLWTFSSGVYTTFPVGVVIAHNITDSQNKPVFIPVYTNRYNYKLPDNHRLDANLDYTIPYKKITLKLSLGAYNIYNHSNPSFIYFKPEQNETGDTKFIPKSKVILPFIPYLSLRLKW